MPVPAVALTSDTVLYGIGAGLLVLVLILVLLLVSRSRRREAPPPAVPAAAWGEPMEPLPDPLAAESTPGQAHYCRCPACQTQFTVNGAKPIVTNCPGCGKKGYLR